MSKSVLVVGCGMTGAVTAFLLSKLNPQKLMISCWDKARGGRMSTSRNKENVNQTVDLGAQYISVTPHYQHIHKKFYDDLLSTELLIPFTGLIEGSRHGEGTKNFVAPKGMNSLVKHFLSMSGANTHFNRTVKQITDINGKWQVKTDDGLTESFDCVIMTPPVPQILQMGGDIQQLIESQPVIHNCLKNVKYSSRYALGLFFADGAEIDVPWTASYVTENPCIRYIAIDNKKRGKVGGASMVVHTSVPFGIQYLESDKDDVQPIILDHLKTLLPRLPEPSEIKCQKWRYSQVKQSYTDSPGYVELKSDPILLCGGDAFVHSNMDGCLSSALKIVNRFVDLFNKL
ncbi:renalase-like isoform X2 [Tubulanus polymorphus]|uniref:renalase-like isoform X2 n=1 Tax=Tubulanus polymorphus TaxID=672921 RepID=UPI003DA32FA9